MCVIRPSRFTVARTGRAHIECELFSGILSTAVMPPFAPRFNSPETSPSPEDDLKEIIARCNRRIAELEAQLKKQNGTSQSAAQTYVFFHCSYIHFINCLIRKSYAALGRAICKVVSTFDSVETLIAEDDRRRDLDDARLRGEDVHELEPEPTLE